jgi:chromate reductase, NAD(P)H dehydrogenase (quinone)
MNKINIIGISGSLRGGSSASAILNVVAGLVPSHVDFNIYNGLAGIPAFDDSKKVPDSVTEFIKLISKADAVFFCIPEYAFGVPGALKNALDWTVSTTAFSDKPVALITAASSGDKAHAALLLTLTALGTKLPGDATMLISFIRTKLNERGEVNDAETLEGVQNVIAGLVRSIATSRDPYMHPATRRG